MSETIDRLEARIARHYESYASRRAVGATLLAGVLSIGIALLVFGITGSALYSLVSLALIGFVAINLAIFFMVPSVDELATSQSLVCGAVRNPSRIKDSDTNWVKLADEAGVVHELKKIDLEVWRNMIIPFLMAQQRKVESVEKIVLKDDSVSVAERKEIERRREELLEAERKIETERERMNDQNRRIQEKMAELSQAESNVADLNAKTQEVDDEALEKAKKEQEAKIAAREKEIADLRKALEDERADLEERTAYVTSVEESLVDRLNELTSREAEIEQEEINAGIRSE